MVLASLPLAGTRASLGSGPWQAIVSFWDSLYQDFARYFVHLTSVSEESLSCLWHYCNNTLKCDGGI